MCVKGLDLHHSLGIHDRFPSPRRLITTGPELLFCVMQLICKWLNVAKIRNHHAVRAP